MITFQVAQDRQILSPLLLLGNAAADADKLLSKATARLMYPQERQGFPALRKRCTLTWTCPLGPGTWTETESGEQDCMEQRIQLYLYLSLAIASGD